MIDIINFLKEFDLHQLIGTAVLVWLLTSYRFKKIEEKMKKIEEILTEIKITNNSMDRRLTRLEGRFEERGYWESRDKRIGE